MGAARGRAWPSAGDGAPPCAARLEDAEKAAAAMHGARVRGRHDTAAPAERQARAEVAEGASKAHLASGVRALEGRRVGGVRQTYTRR